MNPSITFACTFFQEANALPGWLEMATKFADEIVLIDCGPQGIASSDGSLDILRKWGIEPKQWSIDAGFGKIRTDLLHECKTDWAMILDCDERMDVTLPLLQCDGNESYPDVANPRLTVNDLGQTYNHRAFLYDKMREADQDKVNAIRFCRRHWFTPGWKNPTQNWMTNRDYQLRCMRPKPTMGFRTETRMHEGAIDHETGRDPVYIVDDKMKGPFLDHYHCWFKSLERDQRAHDIEIYNSIHEGRTPPTVEQFSAKQA
jgi:hypothetical protein